MAGAASQAGDADSSRAPGLTSGLHGSVNVHRGALMSVPQCHCINFLHFKYMISEVIARVVNNEISLPRTFIYKSKKEVSLSEVFALFN